MWVKILPLKDLRIAETLKPVLVEKMIHYLICVCVCLFFHPPSSAIMSTVLPASINPETLTKWRSIQISSSRQQSMAIRSRTLIGILYSACSLVVLMALNLTVYPFNKGAASCLELSERSSGETESLGKWGRSKKKGQNGMMLLLWCISFFSCRHLDFFPGKIPAETHLLFHCASL